MKYFERVLENMCFKFIPLISIGDKSIFGYKIMKDYSIMGQDKEYMYQMAYEEKIFDDFALRIFAKACIEISTKNIEEKNFFYTLRFNFLNSPEKFFQEINNIIEMTNLKEKNFIFDIKGVEDWKEFHKNYSKIFNYNIILKEERESAFNLSTLEKSKASYMEPRTLDTLAFMKGNSSISQFLIFNLAYEKGLEIELLKSLGVDYYYNSQE